VPSLRDLGRDSRVLHPVALVPGPSKSHANGPSILLPPPRAPPCFHVLFVCKPESHTALYEWVQRLQPGPDLGTATQRLKVGSQWHTYTCRRASHVPLTEGADALKVNGCEVTVTDPTSLLVTLDLLAFLFHTVLAFTDVQLLQSWKNSLRNGPRVSSPPCYPAS